VELGQKLKQARLEQGLSQRQLCADVITRNMLSLIENGSASPSMDTLRYLAGQLGKPVSYFLDEDAVVSSNQMPMQMARIAFGHGEYDNVLQYLEQYRQPDPIFDWEEALLRALALLNLAQEAISRGKAPYALELLKRAADAGAQTPYYTSDLERRLLLLRARLTPTELPVDDTELLARAETALNLGKPEETARYLEAAQVRSGSYWNYLRGRAYLETGDYANARDCLERAWDYAPRACAGFLERCCREQEDFKGAYRYACLLREQESPGV
jgi:transcriptional regulator with XRE-family HTH domain